ncbi:MAG: sulfotransferase [Rhodothermales bacterium]|nr:sulfotransferase [Rhodothermales bacterium]
MATSRNNADNLKVFFGHHKCATSWLTTLMREYCFRMRQRFGIVHLPRNFEPFGSISGYVDKHNLDFLAYTNADMEYVEGLDFYRGFHVIRDPRDITVSAYYSHLSTHGLYPEIAAHRKELQSLSKNEGLFAEIDFSATEFRELEIWDYNQPNVMELKMEVLTKDPENHISEILNFLGYLDNQNSSGSSIKTFQMKLNRLNMKGRRYMPGRLPMFPLPTRRYSEIPREVVGEVIDDFSFKKLSGGRKPGQENRKSHYRKGKAGDWANHFTEDHKSYFKDKFGDLLIMLGYEKDLNW